MSGVKIKCQKFSPERDEKLIAEIAKYPAIYDTEHEDHKNLHLKEDMWDKISKAVSRNVTVCKRRWKSIKDNFYKHKRQQLRIGSSAYARPPKWPLYYRLSFLDKMGLKVNPQPEDDDSVLAELLENESAEDNNYSPNKRIKGLDNFAASSQFPDHSPTPSPTFSHRRSGSPVSNSSKRIPLITIAEGTQKRSSEQMWLLSELVKREEDDVDSFMRSIALTVKKLPAQLIPVAKMKILSAVTDLQLNPAGSLVQRVDLASNFQHSSQTQNLIYQQTLCQPQTSSSSFPNGNGNFCHMNYNPPQQKMKMEE